MIETNTTQTDWEDFWYAPEKYGTWFPEDFYNSESDGRDVEPKTFTYSGWIPKKVFGLRKLK